MKSPSRSNPRWFIAALIAAIATLQVVYPPFHVRRDTLAQAGERAPPFDAASAAETFWQRHVQRADSIALDLPDLAKQLRADPEVAARLGRAPGVGASPVFIVRGAGEVLSVEPTSIRVAAGAEGLPVVLKIGPLFGNTLRDAFDSPETATLGSFDANALSAALNRLAETRVQPRLAELAKPGARLRFVGCAQRKPGKDGSDSLVVVVTHIEPAP